jgi:putative tryptophan/tyrosine transport system substrate-binding protein
VTQLKRREFITLLGSAAAWPLAARAQQAAMPVRLVGVLMNLGADDGEGQARLSAFRQGLQELGWTEGRNIRIEPRWAAGNLSDARRYAAELVALGPDVVFASAGFAARPLREATHSVPIAFVNVIDPVGSGIVESLAHPGGNATGATESRCHCNGVTSGACVPPAHSKSRMLLLRRPSKAQRR